MQCCLRADRWARAYLDIVEAPWQQRQHCCGVFILQSLAGYEGTSSKSLVKECYDLCASCDLLPGDTVKGQGRGVFGGTAFQVPTVMLSTTLLQVPDGASCLG